MFAKHAFYMLPAFDSINRNSISLVIDYSTEYWRSLSSIVSFLLFVSDTLAITKVVGKIYFLIKLLLINNGLDSHNLCKNYPVW